jgi:hypothetical protein
VGHRDRTKKIAAKNLVGGTRPVEVASAATPTSTGGGGPDVIELQDRAFIKRMGTLDVMDSAAVMLVAGGGVYCCNRRGLELLGDGIALRDHKLVATDRGSDAALQRLIVDAMTCKRDSSSRELCTVVLMRRSRRPLLATLLLVHRDQNVPQRRYAILLITDPEDRARPDEAVLRAAYGLTPSEVRFAQSLAAEENLEPDVAESGRRSRAVNLKQLRAVYKKTRTNRKRDLIRLLKSLRTPTQKSTK